MINSDLFDNVWQFANYFGGILALVLSIWAGSIAVKYNKLRLKLQIAESERKKNENLNRVRSMNQKTILYNSTTQQLEGPKRATFYFSEVSRNKKSAIFFLSGLGLDHNEMELRFSGALTDDDLIFLTLPGFEDGSKGVNTDFEDAARAVHTFVETYSCEMEYENVSFVGFSVGADICSIAIENGFCSKIVKNIVFLDPNLNPDTLFISSFISQFQKKRLDLKDIQKIVSTFSFDDVDTWANVHGYLSTIIRKFPGEAIFDLAKFAKSVCDYFIGKSAENVAQIFSNEISNGKKIAVIFSGDLKSKLFSRFNDSLYETNVISVRYAQCGHFDLLTKPEHLFDALNKLSESQKNSQQILSKRKQKEAEIG